MENSKTYGFIGCGNMGGALAIAVAKAVSPRNVYLCDLTETKAETLSRKTGASVASATDVAGKCDYIFLGVKPQGLENLFASIGTVLQKRTDRFVLVTMAAGVPMEKIEKLAEKRCPVIRIMPNTPVSVGEGMILYTGNDAVTEDDFAEFCSAMSLAGKTDRLPEGKIDAACALSGCGPAFVYLFAEALADGGVECGLSREQALLYASQTLYGAAKLLLESEKHPGELKDAVCSPGGTTIAGVHALEAGAFRSCAMDAVVAAYEKTLKMKKG